MLLEISLRSQDEKQLAPFCGFCDIDGFKDSIGAASQHDESFIIGVALDNTEQFWTEEAEEAHVRHSA
jgi:hypothetical protein